MQLLLGHGADVHIRGEGNRTPFQVAKSNGHTKIAQLLLKHGAEDESEGSTILSMSRIYLMCLCDRYDVPLVQSLVIYIWRTWRAADAKKAVMLSIKMRNLTITTIN
jgi:ankyrin repeat protein